MPKATDDRQDQELQALRQALKDHEEGEARRHKETVDRLNRGADRMDRMDAKMDRLGASVGDIQETLLGRNGSRPAWPKGARWLLAVFIGSVAIAGERLLGWLRELVSLLGGL